MSNQFNADEILAVAQQIEENGIRFYTAAADAVDNPEEKELLSNLAGWEVTHVDIFTKMRASLTADEKKPTVFDPDDELCEYLKAMADSVVFTSKMNAAEMFGGKPTYKHILEIALERERDAVIYYAGIKGMVPARLGREKIEEILQEEVGHVALIQKRLRQIGER